MTRDEIVAELFRLQDKDYAVMQAKVIPTINADRIIGVRTPAVMRLTAAKGLLDHLKSIRGQEIIRSVLKLKSGTLLQKMEREKRDAALLRLKEAGLSVRQIERLTGLNRGIVLRA